MGAYVEALCLEMEMRQEHIEELDAIYIGGGTPSILGEKEFAKIMDKIRSVFGISIQAEITSEANPGTLTEIGINGMLDAGINRLSLGVQSLNNNELALLGRLHNSDDAVRAFDQARGGGFKNISVDLIYGIPGQTLETWGKTLEGVYSLCPDHISAYELTPEKNTPLYHQLAKGALQLPDEDAVVEMYNYAIDHLAGRGYVHYEISNYALPGYECRHNLNYWNRGEYLGAGAGAHSFVDDRRHANVCDINRYIHEVNCGKLPVSETIKLTSQDALKELLFLGLRTTKGLDSRKIPTEAAGEMIKALEDPRLQGLIELYDNHIRLTRKGMLFCNEVIVRLMLDIERILPA